MLLNVGDIITAKDVHGVLITGEILKFNVNTLIVLSEMKCYLIRLKDLAQEGYSFSEKRVVSLGFS